MCVDTLVCDIGDTVQYVRLHQGDISACDTEDNLGVIICSSYL